MEQKACTCASTLVARSARRQLSALHIGATRRLARLLSGAEEDAAAEEEDGGPPGRKTYEVLCHGSAVV